jgi:transketolase
VGAYIAAVENTKTPVCLSLSRQATPTLEGSSVEKVAFGAYVLSEHNVSTGRPALIIVATGTEVANAVSVAKELSSGDGIYVRYT